MTDPAARRVLTELYADQGWPAEGEELLHRSLGPRAPELLLEAPGWLGLDAGQLVLDAGCRDATHAIALARRYGCRVLGIDLVAAWLPKGRADAAAAGLDGQVALVQGDLEALPVADGACDLVWCRDVLSCVGIANRCWRSAPGCCDPAVGWCSMRCSPPTSSPPVTGACWSRGWRTRRRACTSRRWKRRSPRPGSRSRGGSGSPVSGPSTSWSTTLATSPRTCWRSLGSPATATSWRPPLGRSGTDAPWRLPPGGCRSCWAGSCRSSMPWANRVSRRRSR